MSETTVTLLVLVLLDLYAMGRALLRPHGVPTTLFWLMVIAVVPFVGAGLYLMAAAPYLPRRKAQRRRAVIRRVGLHEAEPEVTCADPTGMFALCARVTDMPPTHGNELHFLGEGPETFGAIEAALGSARHSIWAEYYIIKNDETGGRFLVLLIAAARSASRRCARRGARPRSSCRSTPCGAGGRCTCATTGRWWWWMDSGPSPAA
jgi:cardiolipin synthase